MAARLFEELQFFDNAGNPLAGGQIFTFVAGTTTPRAAYSDSTAQTPLSNPIILDSAGRIINGIWLLGSYRLRIDDAQSNTLMTLDGVGGLGAQIAVPAVAETTVVVPNGQGVVVVSGIVPANARTNGVYTRNLVALGNSQGLTGIDIGSHGVDTRWGRNIGIALDVRNSLGDFGLGESPVSSQAQDVLIIARGGLFDGSGQIQVYVDYETGTAP